MQKTLFAPKKGLVQPGGHGQCGWIPRGAEAEPQPHCLAPRVRHTGHGAQSKGQDCASGGLSQLPGQRRRDEERKMTARRAQILHATLFQKQQAFLVQESDVSHNQTPRDSKGSRSWALLGGR